MSSYEEGYEAATDNFIKMINNTIANEEVMATLPAKWILGIMRASLISPE